MRKRGERRLDDAGRGAACAAALARACARQRRLRAFSAAAFSPAASMRCERDFAAMIPLTLAVPTMPWPGAAESRRRRSPLANRPGRDRVSIRQADEAADIAPASRPPARNSRKPVACGRLRELLPGSHRGSGDDGGRRGCRQAEQLLQQPMHAGRPEQVLAAHHIGHALAGRRRSRPKDGSWSASPCAPARHRPRPRDGREPRRSRRRDPRPVRSNRDRRACAQRPGHIEPQRIGRAGLQRSFALPWRKRLRRYLDRAARRRDRAARARALPARPPVLRSRRGSRSWDRSDRAPQASPARRDSPRDVRDCRRTGVSHAMPSQARSSRSRPRIPACSAPRRYPRCAAGSGRRPRARQVEIQQRRISVAEMQIAVRARRKAENGWRH